MNNIISSRSYTNTERLIEFLKCNESYYRNSFQYHIHVFVDLNKHLISDDNLQSLQTLMRSLLNGKQTIDGIDNRTWFSCFSGGMYKINITQSSPDVYPTINYHIIAFSNKNDLQESMETELIKRLKKIILKAEVKKFNGQFFGVDGINNLEKDLDKINSNSGFHFFSESVRSLPPKYVKWMYRMMHQEERTFGDVYKKIHCLSYLY